MSVDRTASPFGSVEAAVATLYRSSLGAFVAERKRLAAELKAAGDKGGAARVLKLGKPTASTWTVNQLYWRARGDLDAMFATAARLRAGDLAATAAHREAIATLRARAAELLAGDGHGATESVLRRVTTTLAALAATGSFDPDPPGALVDDRGPPGFEAASLTALARPASASPAPSATDDLALARRAAADRAAADRLAADRLAADHRRLAEAARRAAERSRLSAALDTARGEVIARERAVTDARTTLATAEAAVVRARTIADDLAAKLAALPDPDPIDPVT